MGLSEKTNFEVTLFRAVESGRSRSIDQVIRRISGMIPDEVKKKRPEPPSDLRPPPSAEPEALPTKEDFAPKTKDKGIPEEEKADDNDPVVSIERPEPDETEPENNSREEESDHLSGDYDTPSTEPPKQVRQIKDSKMIEKRISELPDGIRKIMEEKFKGDFVAIEKIDDTRLI